VEKFMKINGISEQLSQKEKRLYKRAFYMQQTAAKKQQRTEFAEREAEINAAVEKVFKKDNSTERKISKRYGADTFLKTFSFISHSICDKRTTYTKREQWKCHSYNEERQYAEFFEYFIYPYYVPKPLLLAAVMQELYFFDETGEQHKSFDYDLIQLCRKWLCDIVGGESFYKRNKDYFTKQEAHFFLTSKIKYIDVRSVLHIFFGAKCKARNMPDSLSRIIIRVFTIKFEQYFNSGIVTSFLDLIARHKDYNIGESELGDVCDFILSEITKHKESHDTLAPFSCSGRTMSSVIALANEWHAQVQREAAIIAELQANEDRKKSRPAEKWDGLSIYNFAFENDEYRWTIKQLCNLKSLINEGREMRHCVASYASRCSNRSVGIFSLSCTYKKDNTLVKRATIEVRAADRSIVQVKGKCNAQVDAVTLNVIKRWAQNNNLVKKT
jgi:hypothetical protein